MKVIEDMVKKQDVTITVLPEFGNAYDVTFSVDADEDIDAQIYEFVNENLINIQDYERKEA